VTKEFLVLSILQDMKPKLEFYKLEKDANKLRLVGMDKNAQIRTINIRSVDPYEGNKFWLTTTGYTEPSTLWLADASKMDSHDKKVIRKTGSEGYIIRKLNALPEYFDASELDVCQRFAASKDGTQVPYFIISKKGLILDKRNPTIIYSYGSFGVSLGPHYGAPTGIAWLARGGVYVEAIIRGGGEFGDSWHEKAMRENRCRAHEDFIAVAEDLVASSICSPKSLGMRGGSSGGLLVANVYLLRPDLFGAVHCASPILDMKRYKAMGGFQSWVLEFGDPDESDWEDFMKNYSPFHNIDDSVKRYPSILFTTLANDPNVHPGHARKMVKKLWDQGLGKKWPAYYYESSGDDASSLDAKQYAFVTTLAYDFLWRKLSKSK